MNCGLSYEKSILTPLHNKQLAAKTDEGNHSCFDALG